jgi:hypothetical protein
MLRREGSGDVKVFAFDPEDYRDEYRSQGWVHIKNGIAPEFFELVREFTRCELLDHRLEGFAIKGKKEQALFEFPQGFDHGRELFDVISVLCGLNRPTLTLSERHIQAYEPSAAPQPAAHKDRFGSQVSVGLSIDIPERSRLVLYPYDHRGLNPFNASAALRNALTPDELPEVALEAAREVELDDEPGDVVAFPGSTTWHLRRDSANSTNLYLKFNDFNCDPLGEDPHTEGLRAATLDLLRNGGGQGQEVIPVVARRFDAVSRTSTRNTWQEVLQARVWGEEPFPLTESQFKVLQSVDGERTLEAVARAASADGLDPQSVETDVRALAERGALDLMVPARASAEAAGV